MTKVDRSHEPWTQRNLPARELASGFTRRGFLAGAGSLLLLGAAGCAGGSGASGEGSGETSGGESGARSIEHELGTTEISGSPERVVALGHIEADMAAALGVQPLAVNNYAAEFGESGEVSPWLEPEIEVGDVEFLDITSAIPFERISALEPEVILAMYTGITPDDYATLSEIAPTVGYQTGPYGDAWQDISRAVGTALDLEDEAERLIGETEEEISTVAEENPQFDGKTFMVTNIFEADRVGVIVTEQDPTMQLLISLGFTPSPNMEEVAPRETGGATGDLSLERLDLLDNDILFMYYAVPEAQEAVERNDFYQRLDVVQRDANIVFEPGEWTAFRQPSVLSIPYVLDEVTTRFQAAAETTE